MTIFQSIILGIIEGFTEFLPVSSTGHLIITSYILGITSSEFLKSFEIIIQGGAILAVVVVYVKKIMTDKNLWKKVIVGCFPTAIIGYGLYSVIKYILLGNIMIVAIALIIGGAIIIFFEQWHGQKNGQGKVLDDMSYREAFIIGCVQSLAVIPGVSRSGATIIGGLAQNISRAAIVEFSFLLAVPIILAAAVLDIIKTPLVFSSQQWGLIAIGSTVSFFIALAAVHFFLRFIRTNTFAWFGWYRIIIGFMIMIWIFI